jgi:hypothetical protein
MKIKLAIVCFVFLLSACTGLTQVDARKWVDVSCSSNKGWDACMRSASKACPKGFDLRNQEEDMMTQKRNMQFACK